MSDSRPTVLIVDDALVMRGVLSGYLKERFEVVGDAGNGADAVQAAAELKPDLILMDVTMPVMDGIEATRRITEADPTQDVVILSAVSTGESVKAGMAAGARDYLFKPVNPSELVQVLDRLVRQKKERQAVPDEDAGGRPGNGVWSFLSAKGGDGGSTLLLGLANELMTMGGKVAVVDADLVFGDLGLYLGIGAAKRPLAMVLEAASTFDAESAVESVVKHPSGLHVVARSPTEKPIYDADAGRLSAVVQFLATRFDYVLVDHPAGTPDGLLPVLDASRYIFPVGRGLPESIKNLGVLVETLRLCRLVAPRVQPVLTRTSRAVAEGAATQMGVPVREYFPNDLQSVDEAVRERMPVTRVAPRSEYTQAIRDFLASALEIPVDTSPPSEGGFLSRIFGG